MLEAPRALRGSWRKQAELVPSDSQSTGASYVLDLRIRGRTLVALVQASATSDWAAYVWERENGAWSERARLAPAEGDVESAALEEDTLVLGCGDEHGVAYVYERSQGSWTQRARLVTSDGLPIGRAVTLDGRTVVSATHYGISPARIYQFRLPAFPRVTRSSSRSGCPTDSDQEAPARYALDEAASTGRALSFPRDPRGGGRARRARPAPDADG